MQVAIKSFLGAENIAAAISAPICGLVTNASIGFLKTPEFCGEKWTVEHLCAAGEVRGPFREAWFAGMSLSFAKQVELVILVAAAAFRCVTGGDSTKPWDLAKKTVVQLTSNTLFAWIGFIGMCSPLYGVKTYAWAVREFGIQEEEIVIPQKELQVDGAMVERIRNNISKIPRAEDEGSSFKVAGGVANFMSQVDLQNRQMVCVFFTILKKNYPVSSESSAWSRFTALTGDFKAEGEKVYAKVAEAFARVAAPQHYRSWLSKFLASN